MVIFDAGGAVLLIFGLVGAGAQLASEVCEVGLFGAVVDGACCGKHSYFIILIL